VSACISAALRSPHIPKHPPLRSDVHRCYTVEEPRESADTLFAQALGYLEAKKRSRLSNRRYTAVIHSLDDLVEAVGLKAA
jgi:hypothetical protein